MDLSGLSSITTSSEMQSWLAQHCLTPIRPVMTGSNLGTILQKIISTGVTSVNGQSGAISLASDDIGEGSTNKYFTDARVATYGDAHYGRLSANNVWTGTNRYSTVSIGSVNSGPQLLYVSGNLPNSGLSKYYNTNNTGYSSNDFYDDTNALQLAFGYANMGVANAALAGLSYFYSPNKPIVFLGASSAEIMRLATTGITVKGATSFIKNVNDGNTALIVNQQQGTGSIQSWAFNNSIVAHIPASGTFFGAGMANLSDPFNSRVQTLTTGTSIVRNVADANASLIVNQQNALSTGNILNLQFGGANKFSVEAGGNTFVAGRFSIGTNTNGAVLGIYSGLSSSGSYSTKGFGIRQDAVTYTSTAAGGTIAATYVNSYANPTLAATNATTLTKAYGSFFNSPLAGANVTLGTSFSAGFAGSIEVGNELYAGGRIAVGFTTTGALAAMVHINPTTFITSGSPTANGFAISQNSINYTTNALAGTPGFAVVNSFSGGTLNAVNTQGINNASTVYIAGAPIAGTNTTITNAWSFYVSGGSSFFGGSIFTANPSAYVTGGNASLVRNTTSGKFETIANTGTGNNVLSDTPTFTGSVLGLNAYFSGEVGGTHISSSYGGALTPGDASFGNVRVSAQNADRRLGVMHLRNGIESWFDGTDATDGNWNITIDGTTPFSVNRTTKATTATQYRLSALNPAPASATDTGIRGEIRVTAGYIYICTATNTWVRTVLSTF
jgi:hypothetical protein